MIRLLHGADFHLDAAFAALPPELAVRRRSEQRQALEQLPVLAGDCDLMLLAGDLFDSARIYRDTLEALHRCFTAFPGQVLIAPGNHDWLAAGSPYESERWPENVHIFRSPEIERICLPGCDVYGAAFTGPEAPALLRGFRVEDPDRINLMVLHGDPLNPNSAYDPITPRDIAASGLDYLALGHVHAAGTRREGRTLCAWPGCLMGRGFDECGPKGVLRAEVSKEACEITFLPVPGRQYEILSVEAGDDPLAAIRAALPADTRRDCYRVLLTGEAVPFSLSGLQAALEGEFFSLELQDRTLPRRELWDACGEDTLRGHFLSRLKAQYDAADEDRRRTIAQAARLGLDLLDGREVTL